MIEISQQQLQTLFFIDLHPLVLLNFLFDERKEATVNKAIMTEYDVGTIFNPAYISTICRVFKNVDVERPFNINFPIQRVV